MRDFPSCFGENGVQIADSSSTAGRAKNATNMVTCVYRTHHLASNANSSASNSTSSSSCLITITWSRSLMGQGFSVAIDDCTNQTLCKVDIKPWLFSKRKGSKSLDVDAAATGSTNTATTATGNRVDVFWDLSAAKFGTGPEPLEGFYVAVVSQHKVLLLLLGDLPKEAYRKTGATPSPTDALFVAKREHVFGKRVYCTRARFCDNGQLHDVSIECETVGVKDPYLEIRIDKKRVMQVKRLTWKFRGNQTILVDGLPVEVFWDVHNWLFGPPVGNAVFMFQTCVSADKLLTWSSTQLFKDTNLQGLGFSLVLYAWKSE